MHNLPVILSGPASAAGSSVLTETVKNAISSGISDMSATASDVILLVIPTTIGVIALTAGVNFALRKIRGVISKAS